MSVSTTPTHEGYSAGAPQVLRTGAVRERRCEVTPHGAGGRPRAIPIEWAARGRGIARMVGRDVFTAAP